MSSFASAALRPWAGLWQLAGRVSHLAISLGLAIEVRKERRMLMRLDDRALHDIGFDKGRAYCEASRSFWDVPVDRLHC
jgi:uncharacterized protein YjiS (DUF1127 family)